MKNLSQMMKQVQEMQGKMQELQTQLEEVEMVGNAGAGMVSVTLNGRGEMRGLKMDPSLKDGDIEVMEDLIIAAFNDAKRLVEDYTQEEMGKLTGGLSLPPGMKLPF
ncbi:MAG: YbaB/EbfC family nucleoid-associated protein [Rhodospirillaceae bacterium]|jgi:nucleoid-associated protein EbfC|nr:YbaB/EbfC family nucleoid-associated protein [Rhodospirillaceae bacterium]MBT4489311.1 YbaB/EbfC family nucleoid-associated protein [Rhodospirillaceae bacterium]MBT5192437.1 YbaB/EbfC family nucleoid-associated protein [Rhodospirillaceae bacterium]MBT5896154.1 YbaB/EbfC family nucleoid-associated protein [Rhodospirillaceae bacterium]MBT6426435.1 YbaB/EbfC family nucleoid-associated protein [Rhodospirillaceae bacterium]